MTYAPFPTDRYVSLDTLNAWMDALVESLPRWVSVETVGWSAQRRPIRLLTLGCHNDRPETKPTLWMDAGTHASEWTGVSAALAIVSAWAEDLRSHTPRLVEWFQRHTVVVVPCVSPDGYDALFRGAPYLRSTLRPSPQGDYRSGFDPCDVDGDGSIRWMRWRDPSGPFVQDSSNALLMRPRTLDDDPDDAFFMCDEGHFVHWDGVSWTPAPREFGVDLNRNFPGHWQPFSMFGMDGGQFPLSEPESRAITDAFAQRKTIVCALSMHTYTGCILTQPYRNPSPLGTADLRMLEALAQDAVRDTGYRCFRVHPDFTYALDQSIVGVWSDTISTVFGLPGYTLELWDPYAYADCVVDKPAASFVHPNIDTLGKLLEAFQHKDPHTCTPWTPFHHPQLGDVEIGGIDYLRTVRNPPERLLAKECATALRIADRMRRALCRVHATTHVKPLSGGLVEVTCLLENRGYLSTSGLSYAESIGACPQSTVSLDFPPTLQCIHGHRTQPIQTLAGWGTLQSHGSHHPIYPALSSKSHRAALRWVFEGHGVLNIAWDAGRGGSGTVSVDLGGA